MAEAGLFWRWRRSTNALLLSVALAASAGDVLFYRHQIGWTVAAFLLLLLSLLLLRSSIRAHNSLQRLLAIACGGLVAALLLEPNALNVLMSAVLLGTLAISRRGHVGGGVGAYLRRWVRLAFQPLLGPLTDALVWARWVLRHPRRRPSGVGAMALWILPIVFSAVFAGLFAIANPLFERLTHVVLDEIIAAVNCFWSLLQIDRIFFWCFIAACCYALLRAPRRGGSGRTAYSIEARRSRPFPGFSWKEASIVVRCLLLFNALFAVESALDLMYLWHGRELPAGFTYVEYAHRGAYPLILTALLAGLFVLVTFRQGSGTAARRDARVLVYAWIAQNILLTFSAAWRLWLLVDASLLTRWRLATAIWLLLVIAGLMSLVWKIVANRSGGWLLRTNLMMAAATLYACCFLNLDGFIADYDAVHCASLRETQVAADLRYFRNLGVEALPALRTIEKNSGNALTRAAAAGMERELSAELIMEMKDPRGWTLRRARLYAATRALATVAGNPSAETSGLQTSGHIERWYGPSR